MKNNSIHTEISSKEKKDIWLIALLSFLLISCLIGLYRNVTGLIIDKNLLYTFPRWYYIISTIFTLLSIIGVYCIYQQKRVGVVAYILPFILDFFTQLLLGTSNSGTLFFIFTAILLIGVKIIPNWTHYD